MSEKEVQITNFDELIASYQSEAKKLKRKEQESYWLRFLFRRIPLFAALGLIFFGVCLALAMTDAVGAKKVEAFLHSQRLFEAGYRDVILVGSFVLLLLRSLMPRNWFVDNDEPKTWRTVWSGRWEKPIALLLMFSILLSGFSWVIAQSHALLLGLAVFFCVTLGAFLADRTLGFTSRNERYQLFASRAEGLIVLSRSRKVMAINGYKETEFGEAHLLECAAFFDELRFDKHNATMSDSFYVLRLKEKMLNRTI